MTNLQHTHILCIVFQTDPTEPPKIDTQVCSWVYPVCMIMYMNTDMHEQLQVYFGSNLSK